MRSCSWATYSIAGANGSSLTARRRRRERKSEAFERLSTQRSEGVPVAYLLGSAGFYGREFLVNDNVLVPRPETEHLVAEAIAFIGNRPLRVLDVGTGSGTIACTIAAETQATVHATDISPAAIGVAKKTHNASALRTVARFSPAISPNQ